MIELRDLLLHDDEQRHQRRPRAWICRSEAEELFPALRGWDGPVVLRISRQPFEDRTSHRFWNFSAGWELGSIHMRPWAPWAPVQEVELSLELIDEIRSKDADLRDGWVSLERQAV